MRAIWMCVVALLFAAPAAAQPDAATMGVGWRMERLDVDVAVIAAESRVEVSGEMTLTLEGIERSLGPSIALNFRSPTMSFERVEADGATVELNALVADRDALRLAHVRYGTPLERGAEVVVRFAYSSEGFGSQFLVNEAGALASWTDAWVPYAVPRFDLGDTGTVATVSVPGETTLRLPAGWSAISDGELVERTESGGHVIERWRLENRIARSFCAAPYEVASREVDGRVIRVAMLPGEKAIGVDRLAGLIADAMAAQEAKWGPFPFPAYGVAEIPPEIEVDWYAASQQTFIMARSDAFNWSHGNLPLWGHEMAHGWWGNTVGTDGPGSKWCSESLAQLGALLAIETLEGDAAGREFLGYSRSGYSAAQCAMGYFWMWRRGADKPIAELGGSGDDHNLSDNKGYWIHHMLRVMIGDETFFGVHRDLIERFAGREMTVDDVRAAFVAAAPEHDLESFFAQWLDRTGAPVLDVDWRGADRAQGVHVTITQTQGGEPFVFDLDIEVTLLDGSTHIETVRIDEAAETFEFEVPDQPETVRLDPGFKVLIYRPGYGPRPEAAVNEEAA